ncbi:hypothetical protein GQR36_06810 [Enterococcus termitis]
MKKWQISLLTVFLTFGGISGGAVWGSEAVQAETIRGTNEQQKATIERQAGESEELIPLQILGINDFHGALNTTGSFYDDLGNKVGNAGTAPLLAGYLNQAEEQFAAANKGAQTLRVQ